MKRAIIIIPSFVQGPPTKVVNMKLYLTPVKNIGDVLPKQVPNPKSDPDCAILGS